MAQTRLGAYTHQDDVTAAFNQKLYDAIQKRGVRVTANKDTLTKIAQEEGLQVPDGYEINDLGLYQDPSALSQIAKAGLGFGAVASGLGAAGALGAFGGAGAASGAGGYVAGDVGSTANTALGNSGGVLGTLGKLGGSLGDIGQVATGAAAGLANGRRASDNTELNAAQLNLNAPMTRAQQVARGDLMSQTIAPVTHTGTGRNLTFSGGLSPALFGPDTRAAGDALKKQALQKLMGGDEFTPSKSGVGENVASGVGLGANILSLLGKLRF